MAQWPSAIGAYRIVEPLGQGGMGVVYRGVHLQSGQPAAVKTVRVPHGALLQSIRREIHALARISHPGVVRIVDEGLHEGLPWYAMELLQGQTLRHAACELRRQGEPKPEVFRAVAESGPWPEASESSAGSDPVSETEAQDTPATPQSESASWWTDAIEADTQFGGVESAPTPLAAPSAPIRALPRTLEAEALRSVLTLVRRLCAPLAFLHGEGIVHRDLKPDNVVIVAASGKRRAAGEPPVKDLPAARSAPLADPGWPVIVDFGLMTQFGGEVSREALEVSGSVVGTMAYMAPEQFLGDLVDARADLYALGCILYELVAGQLPFRGATAAELYRMQLAGKPAPLSGLVDGVPPELDSLVLRLLARKPEERLGHADDVAAVLAGLGAEDGLGAAGPKARAYLYRPRLAGRAEPLEQLEQRLLRLVSGRPASGGEGGPAGEAGGGLVLVGGESGVGKTRLVMEAARRARIHRLRVLTGECVPLSPGPSAAGHSADGVLAALRGPLQAVADHCRERGLAETERLVGHRGKVLALYEPALQGLPGQVEAQDVAPLPAQAARLRLFSYLAEIFSALAEEQPLLLVLDDLQWADDLTLDFLEFLVQGGWFERTNLLMMGTFRSEEVGATHASPLRRLIETPGVSSVALGRLDEAAVGSIVGDMLALWPAPRLFARFLSRHSEGNPFFVAEYLRTAVAEEVLYRDAAGQWQVALEAQEASEALYETLPLPRSVRALVRRRLDGLSDRALGLAEIAAVLGRELEEELLAEVEGLDAAGRMEAERELLARQVLEEAGPTERSVLLRFVHDKLREVAYEGLAADRRRQLHRAAAQALEARAGVPEAEPPAALATRGHHWDMGGEPDRARPCYLAAARKSVARHALGEAERLYRACLKLVVHPTGESASARNELGRDVLQYQGRAPEGIEECKRALGEARQLGDRAAEGQILRSLGTMHVLYTGQTDEAREFYELALGIYRQLGDRQSEGKALGGLAIVRAQSGSPEEARVLFDQALSAIREVGDRESEALILNNCGTVYNDMGRHKEAWALYQQALAINREIGNRLNEGLALSNVANSQLDSGHLDEARGILEQSMVIHREIGNRTAEGIGLANLGLIHQQQGSLQAAEALFEQALAIHRQVGNRLDEARGLLHLATLQQESGRFQESQALYEQALALAREIDDPRLEGMILGAMAALLQPQGRIEEARDLYEQALTLHRKVSDRFCEAVTLTSRAGMERRCGSIDTAEQLLERAELVHRDSGDGIYLARCLCEKGHIALGRGRSARQLLEEAEGLAATAGAGPASLLGREVARLQRSVEAFEAQPRSLFRGELVEDLPEGLRQQLLDRGELQARTQVLG